MEILSKQLAKLFIIFLMTDRKLSTKFYGITTQHRFLHPSTDEEIFRGTIELYREVARYFEIITTLALRFESLTAIDYFR